MESDSIFRLLLRLLLLLLANLLEWGDAFKQPGGCLFPERWEGTWFQSGVRQPIIIDGPRLSSKGRCLGAEGDKFLVVDDKGVCFRCVVIHEKHANVLQYKETYCHGRDSLPSLCGMITGDALLYSMFREDALPVSCPFRGPFTFTYNRGHGECRSPVSSIDVCTEDSRLLFSYQACPDIYGTESTVEELQCLATWKEGSSRYLVGKVHHNHATSNEDRFRCFVYEKTSAQLGGNGGATNMAASLVTTGTSVDYHVAQSGDATCNGVFSATEGSRTMTLKRASSPNKCRFPNWLASSQHWHSLDNSATYSFHHRNSTLRISNTSGLEMKVICAQAKSTGRDDITAMILAHFTMGCQSGYMCMMFYRRDNHVIEVQSGQHVRRQEDACLPAFFNRSIVPYTTLVTATPEVRQCPYSGKFTVTGLFRMNQRFARKSREVHSGENLDTIAAAQHSTGLQGRVKRVMDASNTNCDSEQFNTLVVGCSTTDTMEFHSECPVSDFISAYSCHGRWEDNGTNFLITTPQSRSSHGAKRFCFIYREIQDVVHFSSSSDNCDRNIRPGVEGGLAFNVTNNGKCIEVNDGLQQSGSWWILAVTIINWAFNVAVFQIER